MSSLVAERIASQRLSGPPATTVRQVVDHLLAVQAQDLRGARLAIRARSVGLAASDVDRALTGDRTVVVSWLNRGTLHLVPADSYWWLHEVTTPPLHTPNATRLRQEGVSPEEAERGVDVVLRVLADGPASRSSLRDALVRAGVPVARQALAHLLLRSTLRGHVVRGPVEQGEQSFVLARDWLGDPPTLPERDVVLTELAYRYLVGHAPAAAQDLARWAGIRLGDARRGLRGVRGLLERSDGLVELARRDPLPRLPGPRLLGAFEPLLMGWRSRAPVLGEHSSLVTSNGVFKPFALVDGRAVATWGMPGGRVSISPLSPVPEADRAALEVDAADVERFLAE